MQNAYLSEENKKSKFDLSCCRQLCVEHVPFQRYQNTDYILHA